VFEENYGQVVWNCCPGDDWEKEVAFERGSGGRTSGKQLWIRKPVFIDDDILGDIDFACLAETFVTSVMLRIFKKDTLF
jgi:hypothetical protein